MRLSVGSYCTKTGKEKPGIVKTTLLSIFTVVIQNSKMGTEMANEENNKKMRENSKNMEYDMTEMQVNAEGTWQALKRESSRKAGEGTRANMRLHLDYCNVRANSVLLINHSNLYWCMRFSWSLSSMNLKFYMVYWGFLIFGSSLKSFFEVFEFIFHSGGNGWCWISTSPLL